MAWFHRLRNLARSDRHSRDLDREFDFHIRERVDDLVSQGMDPALAQAEARRRFGNRGAQKERTRDADLFPMVDSIRGDIRYARRALVASPVFTIVAIGSLALGIGANTAIFSLIDALLLKSLPVVNPSELVRVTLGPNTPTLTNPIWEQLRDRQQVFANVFAIGRLRADLSTTGVERPVQGSWVSGGFFPTLGVKPALGRLLGADDDHRGCAAVGVLGHSFWRSEFGGDPGVVGKTLMLSGHPFRIVGVADEQFFGLTVGETQAVYAPLCAMELLRPGTLDHRRNWFLSVMGRPRPGVSAAQISAALATLSPPIMEATAAPKLTPADRRDHLSQRFATEPGGMGLSYLRGIYGKALYALAAIVAIVLLVACANVANLLLARGASRRREVAVRLALGASRTRLARQLVTESLMIGLSGAALGVVIARWGGRLLVGILSQNLPVYLDLSASVRVLGFACAIGIGTALLFGVGPAFRETAVDPQEALKSGGRAMSAGRQRLALGKALVASQLALALVVMVTAALLLGSFQRLAHQNPGFRPDRILLVSSSLYDTKVPDDQLPAMQSRFLAGLRELASVDAVTSMNATPIGGSFMTNTVVVRDMAGAVAERDAHFNDVGAGYFATMGTPLLSGREFSDEDRVGSPAVAIVNRAAARLLFGTRNPIGLTYLTHDGPDKAPAVTIIGVVTDAKYSSLRQDAPPTIYRPITQTVNHGPTYALRSSADPATLIPMVSALATSVEPRMRLGFKTLSDQVSRSLTREELLALLSVFFGGLTLVLAMIGVYGIMAYGVSRRRNEFGIRIAVGATPGQVMRLVTREMLRLTVVGLLVGTGIALAATRLVRTFLYGIEPTDPRVFAGSMTLLVVVACAASLMPALRASRVDPMFALREE